MVIEEWGPQVQWGVRMEIVVNLVSDIVSTLISFMLAYIAFRMTQKQYSGWSVVIVLENEVKRQPVGIPTAKGWLKDPWAMKLGLKSCVSDTGRMLKTNVNDLVKVDKTKREFVITLGEENLLPRRSDR